MQREWSITCDTKPYRCNQQNVSKFAIAQSHASRQLHNIIIFAIIFLFEMTFTFYGEDSIEI